jgi:hypothetical protein
MVNGHNEDDCTPNQLTATVGGIEAGKSKRVTFQYPIKAWNPRDLKASATRLKDFTLQGMLH